MPMQEGRGLIAPKSITIFLNEDLTHRAWIESENTARMKGYKPINFFVGWLGEIAVVEYFTGKLSPIPLFNACYLEQGDNGVDIYIQGLVAQVSTLQVKTHRQGGQCLVKRISETGELIPLKADIFIFCELRTPDISTTHQVGLLGWIKRTMLERLGERIKSPQGHHYLCLNPIYLFPMGRLIALMQGKQRQQTLRVQYGTT